MKKILKKFRLPNKLIQTLIKDSFQYPERLIIDTFTLIGRCGVLLVLYWYVFKLNNGVINGTTFILSAWSIFFYFSFSTLRLHEISRLMMQDVQTGNIEVLFSKPVSYFSYRMWWSIGSGLYPFTVVTMVTSIALILIIGLPATMTIGVFIPTLILTFFCASILTLLLYSIIGLLSFWIEDINPVFWIVSKAVMILGGSYLPIALFPPFLYKISLYSPFGASQFVTHTVYESWQTNWYQLVGIQLLWIILLGFVVYFMFKKAKQKVSVNGG
jgi:ABC-2 type transport system permease protein